MANQTTIAQRISDKYTPGDSDETANGTDLCGIFTRLASSERESKCGHYHFWEFADRSCIKSGYGMWATQQGYAEVAVEQQMLDMDAARDAADDACTRRAESGYCQ